MEYNIDYKAQTTLTAGDGSIPVGDGTPLALWNDNHCIGYAVSETFPKMFISIDWLREHLPKDEDYIRVKGYPTLPEDDLMNMAYDNGFYDGWEAFRRAILKDTLEEWREANE